MSALLATTHPHPFPADAIVATNAQAAPRLRIVNPLPRVKPRRAYALGRATSRLPIVFAILLLHVAIVVALWYAKPWATGPQAPARIEVALIAPPVPEKPKPPPPKVVRDRAPPRPQHVTTAAPTFAPPQLQVTAIVPPMLAPLPVQSPITVIESPVVATAPPVEKVVAPPPVDTVPPRFDAAYLDNPAPLYPASAKRAGEEGRVLLRVLVSADGSARTVEIAKTSGFDRLDAAAIDAVRQWRFVPAHRGGAAVAAHVNVPVVFTLRR